MQIIGTLRRLTFLLGLVPCCSCAETVFYRLENVILEEGPAMTGIFSWSFDPGDFENGSGQFIALDIPYTIHNHEDLDANIDVTQLIEITLAGSVHDDGVDIALVLSAPLTPVTGSALVLGPGESKYEIGGNGFHTGLFVSGSVSPVVPVLSIAAGSPGSVTISWTPDLPGYVLQQSVDLTPGSWTDSPSGSANPVVVPRAGPAMFFRLQGP